MTRSGSLRVGRVRIACLATVAGAMMAGVPSAAFAQEASSPTDDYADAIIVTALKRDTRLQDTPISISAVTGAALANSGVQSIADLRSSVPSLQFVDAGPSNRRVVIRGIQASGEPTVGVYYDETAVTGVVGAGNDAGGSTPELRLFDVDRVEVLRGPQGTLYGSGSMGGTLRVIYKKPTDEWAGAFDGSLSSTRHGGANMEMNGMVNVPIAGEVAAIRATGFYKRNAGYIDNVWLGVKGINDEDSYGGRVLLRLRPTSTLTIDGAVYLNRSSTDTPSWFLERGTYKTDARVRLPIRDKVNLYSGTAVWDLGSVTATAVVSYMERTLSSIGDTSRFIQNLKPIATFNRLCEKGCTDQLGRPITSYADYLDFVRPQETSGLYPRQDMTALTAEARFSSNGDGPINWTVGGFYSLRKTDVDNAQVNMDPVNGRVIEPEQIATQRLIHDELKQIAGFADLSWDVTSKLNLTGGVRYFKYERDIVGQTTIPSILVGALITPRTSVNSSEDGQVFKANLSYKFTRDLMFYFEAAQGFRPGGVNQILGQANPLAPYESDKLWNYEAGIKSSWFNHRFTLNADLFRIDWTNIQVSGRTANDAFSFITNAGSARVQGVEVESSARLIDGLTLSGNLAYMTAKLTENQATSQVRAPGLKGDRIPFVPKFSAGGSAEYRRLMTDRLSAMIRVDYSHMGGSFSDFRPTGASTRRVPAYDLVNLRFGVEASDGVKWGVYAFVTNLFDKVAILRASSSAFAPGLTSVTSAPPRTIGVNFRVAFD